MNSLPNIRKLASILLLLAMVLPLSKCTGKTDPGTGKAAADTVFYGVEMISNGFAALAEPTLADIGALLVLLTVFLLPVGVMLLRASWQAPILLVGSAPASHFLYYWVLVFPSTPLIGGLLAVACWTVLIVTSAIELWRRRRARGADAIGQVPASR